MPDVSYWMAKHRTTGLSEGNHRSASRNAAIEEKLRQGTLLVLAPHMDDETLGCGGVMGQHSSPSMIYCLFATDGSRSPAPLLPWLGSPAADLPVRRHREAVAALAELEIPERNLLFLDLPDGGLASCWERLISQLRDALAALRPEIVLAPFRFDVHPDHVALNRAIRSVLKDMQQAPTLLEYFIYYRLRFVPGGDVRACLDPGEIITVDTTSVAALKQRALGAYESQTRVQEHWQERPILTAESIRERCDQPERFLVSNPRADMLAVFTRNRFRVLFAYFFTRLAKKRKDQFVAACRWVMRKAKS